MREYFDLTSIPHAELRDLQEKELGCLLHLDKICRANNIRYTLGGGTCVGALREGGFIEWDDDVDVWIPRPDYERLHRIWDDVNDDPHYHLCRNSRTECYHINCSFLKDDRGTFINRHSKDEDINHGIPIDIMAMDAAPAGRLARAEQLVLAMLQSIYISQRLPDHQGKVIRLLTHVPLALVRSREARYRIWKWCEKRMTRWPWDECPYAVELTTGFKMKFVKMPREWFDTCKPVMFEGHEVLIADGAEKYMEVLFGDYMQLPPMKDRTAKHNIVYANMDVPYTAFKGKYYCVNEGAAAEAPAAGGVGAGAAGAGATAAGAGAKAEPDAPCAWTGGEKAQSVDLAGSGMARAGHLGRMAGVALSHAGRAGAGVLRFAAKVARGAVAACGHTAVRIARARGAGAWGAGADAAAGEGAGAGAGAGAGTSAGAWGAGADAAAGAGADA